VSRRLGALAGVALAACSPPSSTRVTWTVEDFVAHAQDAQLDFGGLKPAQVIVLEGQPIPYRSRPYAAQDVLQPVGAGAGLPVEPAYAEERPAGFVVTEVWDDGQPVPWVQPVYQELLPGQPAPARIVFPVDTEGSFYSPFWRAELVAAPAGTAPDALPSSATGVLDTGWPLTAAALVYCSFVPPGTRVASALADPTLPDGGPALVHPFTLEALTGAPALVSAWVDGYGVTYLGLGLDSTPADGQRLPPTPMYFFARDTAAGRVLAPLPPVLPDAPAAHALVERVDVVLPAAVPPAPAPTAFVPPALDGTLGQALRAQGISANTAADVDPGLDPVLAQRYLLRVALDPACFGADAGFPASCQWLDSAAHLAQRLPASALQPQGIFLAVKAAEGAP
jgi:hypothetical protein